MDICTPIDSHQYSPRTTPQSTPSSPSSLSGFSFSLFFHFSPDTRFEPPISVAHSEIPRQAQDTVEENPTASRTTTTDTHTAAISSTPTPTQISYIGSDDILTVLLGGSLPGTNTAGNTEACPGQQWLTGTVEEGNLLSSNQPVAHRIQTAVADHFVIRTSIRAEAQGQPPVPCAPTISRHHCLEATDRIATSNYWDVLADGASDDTDTDIHQLTSQFLESANAVADNLSLRLSPPATRSNRRLLSGTTKRAILASNTARQAFIAAATHTNPDPVQCNTLRDEWSRLKATATQLERVDGRKQWVKHADNLDRAVSDGRTDLVFAAARAMSGNSSRSAAVTPLYNSNGIVQYDPTSILRVMQCHYGSLAADTTGHSLDLQYWHDRQSYSNLS
ncbi:hypothetical protein BASA81_017919 [Batrachochytrium salamandrivorans]|nr:hypothetical protein BASA81_017919 [Batrachochytrium salamandrivorans]